MKKLLATLLLLPLGAFAQDNWFEKPLKHVDVLDVADLGAFTPVSFSDKSSYRTMKSGYYKLNGYADFQLDGYLYIPLDAEVVIDLNGVGLDRSLEQDLKNGCVFVVEGKLLIRNEQGYRAIIKGGHEAEPLSASTVLVKERGTFILEGGMLYGSRYDVAQSVISVYGSFIMRDGTVIDDKIGVNAYAGSTVSVSGGYIQDNSSRGLVVNEGSKVSLSGGTVVGNGIGVEALDDVNVSGNLKFIQNALVLSDGKKINVVGELEGGANIKFDIACSLSDDTPKIAISGKSEYVTKSTIDNKFIEYAPNPATDYKLYVYDKILMVKKDYPAIRVIKKNGRSIAIVDGDYYGVVNKVETQVVDSAVLDRKFLVTGTGAYSTVQLPFDVNVDSLIGVKNVYNFAGIKETDGRYKVILENVREKPMCGKRACIKAYKPYILEMESADLKIKGGVQIEKLPSANYVSDTIGDWAISSPDRYYEWEKDDYAIGAYGFNARTSDEISSVGKFVKLGAGAWMPPFRASLFNMKAGQKSGGQLKPMPDLPESLDVVIASTEGENGTTSIGRINVRTGEFIMNRNYDIKGRKLNGAPKARGAYYGKKVLKK